MPALADTQSGQLGGLEWDDGVRAAKVLTTKQGGGQGAKKPRDLGAGPEDAGV
ncbi:hypothetical protein MGN70_005639 [Eutypa lata]|nr:hypothetical protein MGN70_005639 [Eutypa lata]